MVKRIGNYTLEAKIGEGSYGIVYQGTDLQGRKIAAKSVPLSRLNEKLISQLEIEVNSMQQLNSDYVTRLYDVLKTRNNVYLIMEYCGGGDLEHLIKQNGPVPEEIGRRWMKQAIQAFIELHNMKILHRDLKLANILLSDTDINKADIKLADFGFARFVNEDGMAQTLLGTPLFMAPEMFEERNYGFKVDVWSLGVVSYEMFIGRPIFACRTIPELIRMQRMPVRFPEDSPISEACKNFLRRMIVSDPDQRASFEELIQHPFLAEQVIPPQEEESIEEVKEVLDNSYELLRYESDDEDENSIIQLNDSLL